MQKTIQELKEMLSQVEELISFFEKENNKEQEKSVNTLNSMIGQKVIIRTYSAGVWFGELEQKAGSEVILKNARRIWKWWAAKSISLSAVAYYGVKPDKSKIAPTVANVWLEAIEIIPCTRNSISSIEGCKDAETD